MSQYVTPEEFSLTGLPPEATTDLDPAAIVQALVLASGEADSYLRKRKVLPLVAPYDDGLKEAVSAIARLLLLRGARGFSPSPEADSTVVSGRDAAIAWLEKVASGLVEISGGYDAAGEDLGGPLSDGPTATDFSFFTGGPCSCL